MKNDLISRQALCEYALNQKDKSITPNDIMRFPSAQPKERTEERTETHSCDLIERQAAISVIAKWMLNYGGAGEERERNALKKATEDIKELPSAQPDLSEYSDTQQRWIPFKRRKPTEEEVTAFDYIMDCKCPEDGQNILVSINIQGHEPVQYDTFYGGGGEECCLESGYELVEEATAWMPLPEPYAERRTDG